MIACILELAMLPIFDAVRIRDVVTIWRPKLTNVSVQFSSWPWLRTSLIALYKVTTDIVLVKKKKKSAAEAIHAHLTETVFPCAPYLGPS